MRWDGERLYLEMPEIEEYLGVGVEIQCNGNLCAIHESDINEDS